jgi:hypothetical protein
MNMTTHKVSIAKDFSRVPAGRTLSDGDGSGANFRAKVLERYLAQDGDVLINLDDTEGYGSSFLEEAFGGLVRAGHDANVLLKRLHFVSEEDPSLIDEIVGYIREAHLRISH